MCRYNPNHNIIKYLIEDVKIHTSELILNTKNKKIADDLILEAYDKKNTIYNYNSRFCMWEKYGELEKRELDTLIIDMDYI